MNSLDVALIVQGEGRGHMTQALALADSLQQAGHRLSTVLVGTSPHRRVPKYFIEGMPSRIVTFDAPTQVPGPDGRAVSLLRTAGDAARRMPGFVRAGLDIHRATSDAHVVVNLLDLVAGASRLVFRSRTPAVAIAHNYVFAHPELRGAPGRPHARGLLRLYTESTALRTDARVALAFRPMEERGTGLRIAPPLLRPGLAEVEPSDGDYLLAYALNAGYGDLLARWQAGRDDVTVHCYVEGGGAALSAELGPGFHAHDLDQGAFLRHLAGCRAYVGSAGFESICEAFHLGKPVLAVPTEGQLEQTLNAWDAERVRAARWGSYDDLDRFWINPPLPSPDDVADFRRWVARGPEIIVGIIEEVANARHVRPRR